MKLYQPFKSNAKNKKYSVVVMKDGKRTLIHFGDTRYDHYKDSIGFFSQMDHKDEKRRKSYLARTKGILDSEGNPTYNNKNSANYYSRRYLWSG